MHGLLHADEYIRTVLVLESVMLDKNGRHRGGVSQSSTSSLVSEGVVNVSSGDAIFAFPAGPAYPDREYILAKPTLLLNNISGPREWVWCVVTGSLAYDDFGG